MIIKTHKIKDTAILPTYGTNYSAGLDLYACIDNDVTINPNAIVLIDTKLIIEIPTGYYGAICSRSGLTLKHGIIVPNAPGVIDSDYRGEIKVILHNISDTPFTIVYGMRIAQMIIMKYENVSFEECKLDKISETVRGENGFGSTHFV